MTIASLLSTVTNTQDGSWLIQEDVKKSYMVLPSLSISAKDVVARNTTDTVYNDGGTQLASLVLNGIDFSNSDSGVVYISLSDATGTRTVNVYSDSGRAAGDKICGGSRSGDGSITLAEANSSGASGTVTVTYATDDVDIYVHTSIVKYQKYDATGSNQVVKGVCESYDSTTGQLVLIEKGIVKYSALAVSNDGGKEDEIIEALHTIGISCS
jgi:hypothetical protein